MIAPIDSKDQKEEPWEEVMDIYQLYYQYPQHQRIEQGPQVKSRRQVAKTIYPSLHLKYRECCLAVQLVVMRDRKASLTIYENPMLKTTSNEHTNA